MQSMIDRDQTNRPLLHPPSPSHSAVIYTGMLVLGSWYSFNTLSCSSLCCLVDISLFAPIIMEERFHVVIVGGGLIGLLAAHILSRAGIQYVVLEKRKALVRDGGASIGLYPQTARIFDQLGLLEAIQKSWCPLSRKIVTNHVGSIYKDHPRFDWMREK